jgi:hypothetical protein
MSKNISEKIKPMQKLVSFTEKEFKKMKKELGKEWKFVSLVANGNRYVGIVEEISKDKEESIFIPPRKKLKIIA